MSERSILILFAHPALEKSRVNRRLIEAANAVDGVTIHDLYEAYPDFDVDVAREQALLESHDVFAFHHPMYWYSTPALLKQWQDLVLEHGWAYGEGGTKLAGKWFLSVLTTGGPETAYRTSGVNHATVRELLRPIEQTVRLCGVEWLPPFVVHGTHRMLPSRIDEHAVTYVRTLEALRDGLIQPAAVRDYPRLNAPPPAQPTGAEHAR